MTILTHTPPPPPVAPPVVAPVADVDDVVPPDADVPLELPVVEVPELAVPVEDVVPPVAPEPAELPEEEPPELVEELPEFGPVLSKVPPVFAPPLLASLGETGLTSMVVICFLSSLVLPPMTSLAQLTIAAVGKMAPSCCNSSRLRPVAFQRRARSLTQFVEILRSKADSKQ